MSRPYNNETPGYRPQTPGARQKNSPDYKAEIQATHMMYQLVPPDDHQRNIA